MPRVVEGPDDLVFVLNEYVRKGHPDYRDGRSDRIIIKCLSRYFSKDETLPPKEEYPSMAYVYHLPQWIAEGWPIICTSSDYADLREAYTKELGWPFPDNLLNVKQDSSLQASQRHLTIHMFSRLLPLLTGEPWLEGEINEYLGAQDQVLRQYLRKFITNVFLKGMREIIDECKWKGMSGNFGGTRLLSWNGIGRIMFTFAPKGQDDKVSDDANSVTFIGDDSEKRGDRFGVQSCYLELTEAIGLIDEMIKHWPSDAKTQAKVFRADKEVGIG